MPDPAETLELALRLRHDAETTRLPHYAAIMRRAADELEAIAKRDARGPDQRDRQVG